MEPINYENVSDKLIEVVPELKSRYEEELAWWGPEKPGPHIIFGDILSIYIAKLLSFEKDSELLRRIFGFLEDLSRHPEIRIQEIVAVTVCEYLGSEEIMLDRARRFMGPETLKLSEEIEKFWIRMRSEHR